MGTQAQVIDHATIVDQADAVANRAAAALAALQREDGHWVFELEADATIPAEFVLLKHYLGEPRDPVLEAKIARYLRRIQSDQHHGWGLFHGGVFDVSASVKAYFALRMIGDDGDAPHMARARAAIHAAGGAEAVNVFTRIQLALFAAGPLSSLPTMSGLVVPLARLFSGYLSDKFQLARIPVSALPVAS